MGCAQRAVRSRRWRRARCHRRLAVICAVAASPAVPLRTVPGVGPDIMIGLDLTKNTLAVHGIDETGRPALVKSKVARSALHEPIANLPDQHGSPCRLSSGRSPSGPSHRNGQRAARTRSAQELHRYETPDDCAYAAKLTNDKQEHAPRGIEVPLLELVCDLSRKP